MSYIENFNKLKKDSFLNPKEASKEETEKPTHIYKKKFLETIAFNGKENF